MFRAATCLVAGLLVVGCTSDEPSDGNGGERTTQPSVEPSANDGRVEVPSLELSLVLPESFSVLDDPDLVLLARGTQPPAILSVAEESMEIVDVEPREGESFSQETVDGVEAVVVANASIEGLPAGIVSNELLVANGDQSFSLILSTGVQELPAMWDALLSSITIG